VIGLDSNNVYVGPNDFPIGARVCNTGGSSTTVTSMNFVWDDAEGIYTSDPGANTYINLRDGTNNAISNLTLAAGTCTDAYFEVIVNRLSSAYNHVRRYYITATDAGGTVSTKVPRELFVEHLISQNRNSTNDIQLSTNGTTFSSVAPGGNMTLSVGNTYWIKLVASTATQGYNQLEDFITLTNTIFQVLSVQSHYSADSSGYVANSSDKLYADACLWDNDPNSLTYRSCIGSDGKVGGSISTTYKVKIISGAGTTQTLNSLIYNFSGSSYHYNSDYSTQARFASITSPLTMTKSFNPVSITSGSTSTLSIAITNSSDSAVTGVSLTDTLPAGLTISGTPTTPQCGGTISSTTGSLTITGATIPAKVGGVNGVCTVTALVTSSSNGSYTNTTGHLFINGSDTGTTATANLTVAATVTPTGICGTMAEWKMTPGGTGEGTNPPGPVLTTKTVATAIASYGGTGLVTAINTSVGNPVNSWRGTGWQKSDVVTEATTPYFQFAISTNNYTSVILQFDATILSANPTGPSKIQIYKSNDNSAGSYSSVTTATPIGSTFSTFGSYVVPFNASGTTYYRLYGTSAQNSGAGDLYIDNIRFSGCGPAIKPTISKAFNLSTIAAGSTSTLTFTLNNTNAIALTSTAFTDNLPSGVQVAATPSANSTCVGATFNPGAGATSLIFSGGTIPANGSCTASVVVTSASAGVYNNTSGYISSAESGTNSGAGGSASATLTVLAHPVISKAFSPNPIYSGSTSTLKFTITNPNSGTALTGVGFTDTFPANLSVSAAPVTPQCGGTVTSTLGSITLTGGSIPAGSSCSVSVLTTSSTPGSYENTSGAVASTNGGTGNTAKDTLGVQVVHPGISILKQVSTSSSGPWTSTVSVLEDGNIYYRITIENTGDVALSPVSVTDPTLDISSCVWPTTLPVGTSSIDPTASCLVGPVTAVAGSHSNTATARGTYSSTVYNSAPSTATYTTTKLTLVKSVSEGSFSAAGNVLHYNYTITNAGSSTLALPASVSDTNSGVSCPANDAYGRGGNELRPTETTTCTATYTVTAFDVSVGSITNTAFAIVDSIRTNNAQMTIYINKPDLTVSKVNDTGGYAANGTAFNWKLTVFNKGAQAATFTDGQTILSDQLPSSGATYSLSSVGSFVGITNPGNINCSINGSKLLTCLASGANVTIGATTGSFAINIQTTPNATGSLINSVTIDPNNNIDEGNEGNNNGSDSVTVVPGKPTIAKAFDPVSIAPGGTSTITFTISNPNDFILTNANFTDTLSDMSVSSATIGGTCINVTNNPALTVGDTALDLTIPILPVSGCTVTIDITSDVVGVHPNTASGVTTDQTSKGNASSSVDLTVLDNPSMTVVKSSTTTEISTTGSVPYSYLVTNTGNVTLTGISLSDNNDQDDMNCPATSLVPTDSMTCTASHTVTQAELDAGGTLDNTVTASSNEADDATDDLSIPFRQDAMIGVAKQLISIEKVSSGTYDVTFEILVKNYGNVTLTDVNVVEDLTSTFPDPTTFEVRELSSSDLGVNWSNPVQPTDFDGDGNMNLLASGVDLPVGAEGKITLVVRVIPAEAGPFENTAVASGQPPSGDRVVDNSSDGTDPDDTENCNDCVNGDGDPTNNTLPTLVTFGDNIFDPPYGVKVVDQNGMPLLKWTMEWINNANHVAQNVVVHDPIPFGTTYYNAGDPSGYDVPISAPDLSTNIGVSCETTSVITTITLCYYEGPTFDHPLGQIIWSGSLGPDFEVTDPALAINKITISFNVTVLDTISTVSNEATIDSYLNGDSDSTDPGEQRVATAEAVWNRDTNQPVINPESKLPDTGFAPGRISILPEQPKISNYSGLISSPWLEIPTLGVQSSIVGVPLVENKWDVTWLWDQTGWLEGSAYPSSSGNSILTSHVYLADGTAGPFVNLSKMTWGQKIILHVSGERFIYEVQSVTRVAPSDRSAFKHEDSSWLTLVTCQGYDEKGNSYQYRILVRGKLLKVEQDQSLLPRIKR